MSKVKEEEPKLTQEQEEESKKETNSESVVDKDGITQPSTTIVVQETESEQTPPITDTTNPTPAEDLSQLPENVRILKEAFPDIDVDVIETILQIQGNSVDSSFEVLLGMSDPNYESTTSPSQQQHSEESTPPMPPRPNEDRNTSNNGAPYAYYERQNQSTPISVEEQLRLDEEFAKKLAMEDEMRNERRVQRQQQQRRRDSENDDDSLFNLQEELPIIKEKMREAGNAAKKKMMDFYNQIKANTRNNNTSNQHESNASSSIPTTNAQYRGLPSDDGDDLLTGDISALHLSDYDVYAQTGGRQKKTSDINTAEDNDIIQVNPSSNIQTSTSNAQLKADEDFARQLAEEERLEARRSRQSSNEESLRIPQQQMPARKPATPTVVIAPRSPLEFEGDSDYEDIGLTASTNVSSKNNTTFKNTTEDSNSVPYVIGDDDDSDSDDLVDIDEDELFDEEEEEETKGAETAKKVDTKKESDEIKKDDNNNITATANTNADTNTTTTTTTTSATFNK